MLDELPAGGIQLDDAMIHPLVQEEEQQHKNEHEELRDKWLRHYIVARDAGETIWLRSLYL